MSRSKRAKLSHDRAIFTKKQQATNRFENLSEDVLSLILSQLPLNEVVRTSTLSSKWRHRWTSYPKLRFDGTTMCGNRTSSEEQYTQKFIENVNAVLKQCSATIVEEFQIKFPFHSMLDDHLNNWVNFAVSSRTKNLTIDLEPEDIRRRKYRYMFPFELFNEQSMSRLQLVRLNLVSLKTPPHFSGFPNLKVLDLCLVDVSSNDLQLILSSCFNLERLSIVLCRLHDDLRASCPMCPLPRLQHLHVADSDINKIQFIAKDLTTFVYAGKMIPLDLSETLPLRHAEMDFPMLTLEYAVTELPRAIPHVQNLNLSAWMPLKALKLQEDVSKFFCLKHLKLRLRSYGSSHGNLLSLASILKAAPQLEVLDIHFLGYCYPLWDHQKLSVRSLPPCRHDHLKRVHITGFHGGRGQIELAAHIADSCIKLEALVIDPALTEGQDNRSFMPEGREMFLRSARDNARRYLAERIAQGVQFDVL